MLAFLALVPFGMSVQGLRDGWISLPSQRPYTRRLQPLAFWIVELVFIGVGIGMIVLALIG